MKAKKSFIKKLLLAAMAALTLTAVACNKEHQCKCTTTSVPDDGRLKLLTVRGSMKCEDITEWAIERHAIDSVTHEQTLARTDTSKVRCREYGE